MAHKSDGSVTAEYLVRPNEVEVFCEALTRESLPQKKQSSTIILRLLVEVPDGAKHKIQGMLRSADRIVWNDKEVVIFLENCKDPKAVEQRIRNFLNESLEKNVVRMDITG